tara:strand:- start:339 stop:848 length:510 start_codon:yes stop_codon:yes gene_type:complete
MEFVQMKARFPSHIPFYLARAIIDDFVADSLYEFKVAPTNEQLQTYITSRYKGEECTQRYCLLVELTEEEAINTVSSRSMGTYEVPVRKRKLSKEEKRSIKSFRKKEKLNPVNKKCEICQYEFKKTDHVYTLDCGCQFHGACIKNSLEYRKTCPLCYKEITLDASLKKE